MKSKNVKSVNVPLQERVDNIKKRHQERESWTKISELLAKAIVRTAPQDKEEKKKGAIRPRMSKRFADIAHDKDSTKIIVHKNVENFLAIFELFIFFAYFTSQSLQNSILSTLDCPEIDELFNTTDAKNATKGASPA